MCRKLFLLISFVLVLGLVGNASAYQVVDDFESGNLDIWEITEGPEAVSIGPDPTAPSNNCLVFSPGDTTMRTPWGLPEGNAEKLSYRLMYEMALGGTVTLIFGAADPAGTDWANYYAIARMNSYGDPANIPDMDVRDGGAYTDVVQADLEPLRWYDVMLDIDTASKKYDVYIDGVLVFQGAAFRSSYSPANLEYILLRTTTWSNNFTNGTVYVDDIVLGEPGATITVEAGGDIAAANAAAVAGDVIDIAAGTYAITTAIEIKDGVTYKGAGTAQTIIDCGGVTRAFVGWGDRAQNDDLPYSETGYPANTSGPKGWVIQGLKIINGVADDVGKSVRRIGDPAIDPPLTANEILNPDKSTNGGGILVDNGAEGTLIDVAFDNCNALAVSVDTTDPAAPTTSYLGSGGAVDMGWGTVNILDCSFTNNSASNDGGAVRASNPEPENWDLSIENSTFTNNSARDDGGAIYSVRRNLSVINCTGDGNKTGLDPAIIADNTSADPDGGFLYVTGAGKVSGTSYTADTPPLEMIRYGGVVKITGCTITNGDARRGGGIRTNSAAQLIITDTSFTNCNAIYGGDGGTIFANSPSPFNPAALDPSNPNPPVGDPGVYLDGVTVDGGTSEDDGGGINIDNWGLTSGSNYIEFPKVVINNCVVKNCRAGGPAPDDGNRDGGGIRVNQRLNVTITNTLVENCTAGRHAAGIYFNGIVNAALIDSCRISNCTNDDISGESGDGTALFMDEDDNTGVVITNCIFDNNENKQDDGVVRIDGDIIIIANCTFVGNKTADHGILYFSTSREDPAVVTNKAVNNLFVNNDSSPGSDCIVDWGKDGNNNIILNNGFFGSVLDNDSQIEDTKDADLGPMGNFIASADPLVDTAGGDYHLAPGSEAIDAGTAEDAPDHDYDGAPRPQGTAHDVGAYEAP